MPSAWRTKRSFAKSRRCGSGSPGRIWPGRYGKAEESAAKAEAAIRKANPDARRELAQAILLGYLGAVMLGYRLGEDLKVRDARIMAEVPSGERFGKASLEALSEWRPKSLPPGGSDCHFVTFINFVID